MILPTGFRIARSWAHDVRIDDVIDSAAWSQTAIRIYGRDVLQPRLTSWMGSSAYTYSGRRHEPIPMPIAISDLHQRVSAAACARFNSVLANQYRDGSDSVSWHADDEPELGTKPTIASLSLGATRRFKIRQRATGETWTLDLHHGDLLIMSGASQRDYLHAVPKTKAAIGPRINLTFRWVA